MTENNREMKSDAGITRRNVLNATAIGLGTIGVAGVACASVLDHRQQGSDSIPTKLRTSLHQEVAIHASPQRIYDALLSSKQFAAISGVPAEISAKDGGALSMFDKQITGRNIELVPGIRIVQAWRPGSWGPGVYSIVKFEFKANGDKTTVILDHSGFPEGDYESLGGGWDSHYWKPLQAYFP